MNNEIEKEVENARLSLENKELKCLINNTYQE